MFLCDSGTTSCFANPEKGGVVAWHQDYSYWTRTKPIAHLTCWCGLDDSTIENGCLQYVPGSQRWGLLDKPELAGNMMGIMDYLTPQQREEFRPVYVETKAGEAIFHHSLTLHGSSENKSDRPEGLSCSMCLKTALKAILMMNCWQAFLQCRKEIKWKGSFSRFYSTA